MKKVKADIKKIPAFAKYASAFSACTTAVVL